MLFCFKVVHSDHDPQNPHDPDLVSLEYQQIETGLRLFLSNKDASVEAVKSLEDGVVVSIQARNELVARELLGKHLSSLNARYERLRLTATLQTTNRETPIKEFTKEELKRIVEVTAINAGRTNEVKDRIDAFDEGTYRTLLRAALEKKELADSSGAEGGGQWSAASLQAALDNLPLILSR